MLGWQSFNFMQEVSPLSGQLYFCCTVSQMVKVFPIIPFLGTPYNWFMQFRNYIYLHLKFHRTGRIFALENVTQSITSLCIQDFLWHWDLWNCPCFNASSSPINTKYWLLKILTREPRYYPTNQLYVDYHRLKVSDIHTHMCMGLLLGIVMDHFPCLSKHYQILCIQLCKYYVTTRKKSSVVYYTP